MEFFLAQENIPFTVAILVMVFIAILEGVGALLGLGITNLIESLLPDIDIDVSGPDIDSNTTLTHFLGWLRVGEVPFLILLIVFLTWFGILGLLLQKTIYIFTNAMLPNYLASIPAVLGALPCVRVFGGLVNKIMPRDETEAVSTDSFIGRIAVLTLGSASNGSPAEAKLTDKHHQTHYIMVEPDNAGVTLNQGESVLIVRKAGTIFKVIRNTNKSLEE